jgi:hypothetical protein
VQHKLHKQHMQLNDAQVLAAKQNHPQHLGIQPFMKAIASERRSMDFTVD